MKVRKKCGEIRDKEKMGKKIKGDGKKKNDERKQQKKGRKKERKWNDKSEKTGRNS